jgi:hypothetical protein
MLADVQFALVSWGREFCLRVCFGHGDVSISSDGKEAVRRRDDGLWCVVPRIPGAEGRRANIQYEGRNFVWTRRVSALNKESVTIS